MGNLGSTKIGKSSNSSVIVCIACCVLFIKLISSDDVEGNANFEKATKIYDIFESCLDM